MTPSVPAPFRRPRRTALSGAGLALSLLVLGACTTTGTETADGGIGYREARYAEISALQTFRACRDEALALDEAARASANAGRYLASARMLEGCERELPPEAAGRAVEERMRAYALGIQNYVKGGDVAAAQRNLDRFESAFPGRELYLADGSAFTDTMRAVLDQTPEHQLGSLSTLNVDRDVKAELRRVRHWTRN
jgi:hypothetical protein